MIASGELVFVPGVGSRSAASAMLATPVTAERGEWSVTIERLVTNADFRSKLPMVGRHLTIALAV